MYRFEPVSTDDVCISQCASFLATVFNKPALFTPQFLRWQYAQNPMGQIVGYNAYSGNELAAHYATQPLAARLDGNVVKGLLSLNTATHDQHRGKGLFVQLAEQTYRLGALQGYDFVIGVANESSVHGFVNKLGFQLVGQLKALLGTGSITLSESTSGMMYERIWDEANLKWRLSNPVTKYAAVNNRHLKIFAKTHLPGIKAQLGDFKFKVSDVVLKTPGIAPLTLWLGVDAGDRANKLFFNIPNRFRSAPLHLIFKDLTGKKRQLELNRVRFQAIDFDAY